VQTTGRDYRALSEAEYGIRRTNDVEIAVRDGVTLLADLFRPDAEGRFPALLSFSCYPRQIQDVGPPIGFVEAGASDYRDNCSTAGKPKFTVQAVNLDRLPWIRAFSYPSDSGIMAMPTSHS
jgi:hypothetical protein